MIGSLMSRMGMAEKLSVAQLQKAVQDGTLPAYVGVPLIQDKMQKEQAARAAAMGMQQQGQPPIAEQVMQAAQAQEAAQGIETVPSNLPEQGFAGGGIVAFAAGGDTEDDDEEDDTLEERRQAAQTQALFDAAASRLAQGSRGLEGAGVEGAGFGIKAALPQAGYTGEGIKPPEGVEGLRAYILQKESGGRRYDKNGNLITSSKGAQGEMQVMPGTARDPGFGIKPARDNSPEELRRVGDEYVAALYGKYRDPKLAAMAYNWGPGNVDKWLAAGADPSKVPGETKKYVASLAGGGIVALAAGGTPDVYTDPMGGATPGQEPDYSQKGPSLFNDIAQWWKEHSLGTPENIKKEEQEKKAAEEKRKADETKKAGPEVKEVPPLITPPAGGAGVDTLKAAPEDSIEKKYLEMLTKREAGAANQRSIDNYMALLQAGLGMMGSKSLTPLGAIGEGASSGIAAKLAAEKTRAAEEAATLKGYGTLHAIQQNAALRKDLASQAADERKTKTLGVLQQNELKNVLAQNKLNMEAMTDPNIANKINQQVQNNLSKNPGYTKMYQDVYGAPYIPEPVAAGAVNYTSTYGLTPQPKK
jgi:hypothetical protein